MSRRQEKAKAEIERLKAQVKPPRTARQLKNDARWEEEKAQSQALVDSANKKQGGGR